MAKITESVNGGRQREEEGEVVVMEPVDGGGRRGCAHLFLYLELSLLSNMSALPSFSWMKKTKSLKSILPLPLVSASEIIFLICLSVKVPGSSSIISDLPMKPSLFWSNSSKT